MVNKDRLMSLMKKYNVKHAIHSNDFDPNAKKANGTLIFECDKNDNLCSEAFAIYSDPIEDLDANETQDLFIGAVSDSCLFSDFRKECTKDIYANL